MSDAHVPVKTEAVGATRVRIPLRRPFATSAGTWHAIDAWIIRVRDGAGREGFGEASLGPGAAPTDRDRLAALVRSTVAGSRSRTDDDAGPMHDAAGRAIHAALEAAALDLGALDLRPLEPHAAPWDDVAVNATIATEGLDQSVEAARDAVERGFRCLKLKVGSERSTAELAGRIGAVRDAVGDGIEIRLDANGAWDPATAIRRLSSIADLDIAYLEQPIAPGDATGLAAVHAASGVAIAADESVTSVEAARTLIEARSADVLIIKPSRVGGPGASLSIAREAVAAGVAVTISTLLDTGVGLAAAARVAALLPDRDHAHGLATADALGSDLLATPISVANGRLVVPALGLRLDEAALARWSVDRLGADA
jgi:o-succinylbenzoate synthase